jgi:hypothetical protein
MDTKQAVQVVTGRWVDVEETQWITLRAEQVRTPTLFAVEAEGQYAVAFNLVLGGKQPVTFELPELNAVVKLHEPKAE